jgi:pimeloyl-ACP methyl ester carboxylesterase
MFGALATSVILRRPQKGAQHMTLHIDPKAALTPAPSATTVLNRTVVVDGLNIFYREAGNPTAPKLVLLHGFPAFSHQYRNLIPALATRFHVIAPDYPGFGNSDMPDPATYAYTFERTSQIIESFLENVGFTRFGLFVQDYGGPSSQTSQSFLLAR